MKTINEMTTGAPMSPWGPRMIGQTYYTIDHYARRIAELEAEVRRLRKRLHRKGCARRRG